MHEVLVNRLGGLSLPRKSVVRLTDRPDMTLDVYRGRKTTMQQYFVIRQLRFTDFMIFLSLYMGLTHDTWHIHMDKLISPSLSKNRFALYFCFTDFMIFLNLSIGQEP